MKIMVVIPKYVPDTYGGAEFEAKWLSEAFVEHGHEIVLVTEESDELPRKTEENGVMVYRTIKQGRAANPQAYYEVLKQWRQEEPDVIHGHHVYPTGLWLYPIMKLSSTPVFLTSHAEDIRGENRWENGVRADPKKARLVEAAARACNKLILCGSNLIEEAEDMGLDEDDYTVINNAIPLEYEELNEETIKDVYSEYGLDSDKKTAFFISRLVPKKGLDVLLDAVAEGGLEDIQFVIAGTGPLEDDLQERVDEEELDNVHLIGRIPEQHKEAFFQGCDIFVFPSYSEGFPIVILEAMKYGCTIVASDIPGPRDVLNKENASLFSPGNKKELISVFKKTRDNPNFQSSIKELSPKNVAEKYINAFLN